ncbi:MAG: hypothetical protein ABW023_00200 [Sphingomonas sp.]
MAPSPTNSVRDAARTVMKYRGRIVATQYDYTGSRGVSARGEAIEPSVGSSRIETGSHDLRRGILVSRENGDYDGVQPALARKAAPDDLAEQIFAIMTATSADALSPRTDHI